MGVSSKLRPGKLRPQTLDPKTHALPSTSERITLTQNSLTSVIDCGTPSKLPPKCTKCCAVFAVNGILQNQAYISSK